jgi:hypothetical protein
MGSQSYEVLSGDDKVALALSSNIWVLMLPASCKALDLDPEVFQVTEMTNMIYWRP